MWALILPGSMSVWNMIIMRTYFQSSIPDELYESACLDGCSDGRFLLPIVLPLSKTILAVIAMFYAVGHWNNYFAPMLYLTDMKKYPLQLVLREILILGQMESDMMRAMDAERYRQGLWQILKYAVIVVSSVPMLIVYVFIQKYFIRGVMIGAIKG
jgi:multiple sugar transport system permease protein/putative aldouronate transport system permease protein